MTDRAREAIFNMLDVRDADVLDLYAGVGSLGLEALSRGASTCLFVERERRVCAVVEVNIAVVGLGGEVACADVTTFLGRSGGSVARFDLVFVDPPYPMELASVEQVLIAIDPQLRQGGYVILHRRAGEREPLAPWPLDDERKYGGTQLWWYRKEAP